VLGAPAREPWRFEEPTRGIIVAWLRLRYRLLPYLYTLAYEASVCGAPLVRPLWWPVPDGVGGHRPGLVGEDELRTEPAAAAGSTTVDDAFLLGPALLVAPVTVAGATARHVGLPAGDWRSLWAPDDGGGTGGTVVRVDAPAGRIPVFVRAGSIVPLDDGWTGPDDHCRLDTDGDLAGVTGAAPSTLGLDHAPVRLAFHCWPTDDGEAGGSCVDDAGDGDGPVRRDTLRLTGAVPGGSAVVTWERHGDYPAPAAVRVVLHGFVAESATADGLAVRPAGSSIECGAFSELRLDGLRPVSGWPP
jgi:alpha-glucosidase